MRKKRKLFDELMEGFDALADQRAGKRTLRTHAMKPQPVPELSADELMRVREDMKLSRSLFARYLRTNVRTLENWEQGRAKQPNQMRKRRCSFASCSAIPTPFGVSRRSKRVRAAALKALAA